MENNFKKKNEEISSRIMQEIDKRGLTAYQVWNACKIPSGSFYKMLNAESEWRLEWLMKIAEFFGVSLDYLINGPPDEQGEIKTTREEMLEKENRALKEELAKVRTFIGGAVALLPQIEHLKKGKRKKK